MKPFENASFLHSVSLIATSNVTLNLHKKHDSSLLLSSNLIHPQGTVYYTTTPGLLVDFLTGLIGLQSLFNQSWTDIVEVVHLQTSVWYKPGEADIQLRGGNCSFEEIFENERL